MNTSAAIHSQQINCINVQSVMCLLYSVPWERSDCAAAERIAYAFTQFCQVIGEKNSSIGMTLRLNCDDEATKPVCADSELG